MKRYIRSSIEDEDLRYTGTVNGHAVYRKIADGKGQWFAQRLNFGEPDSELFPITYEQALGYEPMPDETNAERIGREVGEMLLGSEVTASSDWGGESGVSFDFICPGKNYPTSEMGGDLMEAIDMLGYSTFGYDFRDVDYSSYPEYANENDDISQGGIDFKWRMDYDQDEITDAIARVLESYNCVLIGVDFYSLL